MVEAAEILRVAEAPLDARLAEPCLERLVGRQRPQEPAIRLIALPVASTTGQSATSPRSTAGSPFDTISRSNRSRSTPSYSMIGRTAKPELGDERCGGSPLSQARLCDLRTAAHVHHAGTDRVQALRVRLQGHDDRACCASGAEAKIRGAS